MITTDKTQLNINVLTQEQYENAKAEETLEADALYMIDDDIHQMGVELDFDGVEKRELLWTNPSPTSEFAAQTIPLDLSGYEEIEIFYRYDTSTADSFVAKGKVADTTRALISTLNGDKFGVRRFSANPSGVVVDDGHYNGAVSNIHCLPTQIYGIKKLQPSYNVIPQQVDYVVDNTGGNRVWKSGRTETYADFGYVEKREVLWYKDTVGAMGAVSITPNTPQGGTWVGTHEPTWFDEIEIYFVWSTNATYRNYQLYSKGSSNKVIRLNQCSGDNNRCGARQVTPTSTGFTLENAMYNESASSTYVIPIKIVGIKHA